MGKAQPISNVITLLQAEGMTVDQAIKHLQDHAAMSAVAADVKAGHDPLDEIKLRRIIDEVLNQRNLGSRSPDAKNISGQGIVGDPDEAEVLQLRKDAWWLGHLLQRAPRSLDPERITSAYRAHKGLSYKLASVRKALDTTDASAIVPTAIGTELLRDVEKASPLMTNIRTLDMPTQPWTPPYQSSNATIYGVDESTTDDAAAVKASDLGVAAITFNAKKMGARLLWSRELDEDSAIAILPIVREDFIRITRDGWERAHIFGDETTDNTNINQEGTAPTTTAGQKDHWLQNDGLVHHCVITNTGQAIAINAAITMALWRSIRAALGKYGDNPSDLVSVVTRELLYDLLNLTEVQTMDKIGTRATILTGSLGIIDGTNLFVSDGLPKTDATGKIDDTAGDNVKKSAVMFNRVVGAMCGRRGDLRIEVEPINKTDQYEGVVFSRRDIQMPFVKGVSYGYGIT